MKYNRRTFVWSNCITIILTTAVVLGWIYGLKWMPKGSQFSFDTLGVFLGAIGSVGAIFAIWVTTRKQVIEQNKIQKQNVRIQLFEKRYEVYQEIECLFSELRRKRFSLISVIAAEDDDHGYDLYFRKVKHLFGNELATQANDTLYLAGSINQKLSELKKIYNYIIENLDIDGEFKKCMKNGSESIGVPDTPEALALCEKYSFDGVNLGYGLRNYNYYNVQNELTELVFKFGEDSHKLLKDIESELHIQDVEV